jgi:hypothetical protein
MCINPLAAEVRSMWGVNVITSCAVYIPDVVTGKDLELSLGMIVKNSVSLLENSRK